jgi:hypothetical protein
MTSTPSRKSKKNIGPFDPHAATDPRDAYRPVLNVERLLKTLLNETTNMFVNDRSEAERFFTWFFDTTTDAKSLESFINAFIDRPPIARLGYARVGAELPAMGIVMENEEEADSFLGEFVGEDGEGHDAFEYTGALFNARYTVYIYASNPDMCALLYQYAKAVVHAGKGSLFACGVLTIDMSGGELAPDESYMPENMFVRALRTDMKHPFSAPRIKPFDLAKVKVTGLFGSDVVVDGQRGKITTYVPGEDDGEA